MGTVQDSAAHLDLPNAVWSSAGNSTVTNAKYTIYKYAFFGRKEKTLNMYKDVIVSIGENAFAAMNIDAITFDGTEQEWDSLSGISKAFYNNTVKIICTDKTVTRSYAKN